MEPPALRLACIGDSQTVTTVQQRLQEPGRLPPTARRGQARPRFPAVRGCLVIDPPAAPRTAVDKDATAPIDPMLTHATEANLGGNLPAHGGPASAVGRAAGMNRVAGGGGTSWRGGW